MEKHEKIGYIEAISLFFIAMVNTVTLNIPNNILQYTGTSSWINVIYITIISIFFCLFIYRLYKPFGTEDVIDISDFTGGNYLKWIIGVLYIIMFLGVSSLLLKYLAECLKLIYFSTTPILYILGFFVVATIFATTRGISGIIRNNLILFPFLLLSIVLIFVSVYKHFIWQRLVPILGKGFNETFLGGLSNIFVFNGLANIYFLMPFLREKKDFKKLTIFRNYYFRIIFIYKYYQFNTFFYL